MAFITQIYGVQRVLDNITARNGQMALQCQKGLIKAGLRLQRESQKVVPVEFGSLKASAYTRAEGTGFGTVVQVGYTAAYALYVHEQVGMVLKGQPRPPPRKGKFWDPQGRGQAKFLEEPLRRFTPELVKIVKDEMQIT
jgi:hypothetical protein